MAFICSPWPLCSSVAPAQPAAAAAAARRAMRIEVFMRVLPWQVRAWLRGGRAPHRGRATNDGFTGMSYGSGERDLDYPAAMNAADPAPAPERLSPIWSRARLTTA